MSEEKRKPFNYGWHFVCLARGLAGFLSLYSLLSIGASTVMGVYNQNAWWIDYSTLPDIAAVIQQFLLAGVLGLFALRVPEHIATRVVFALPIFVGLVVSILNTASVYSAAAKGTITLGFPLAFSLFVAGGLLFILVSVLLGKTFIPAEHEKKRVVAGLLIGLSFAATFLLFPLGQMHCFGTTNYRVPVDAAVVLGAQVLPSGTPSDVLKDRLDTAIQFYEDGYTSVLVMSGGIDVDGINEAKAMRDYAVERGVPFGDIIIDEQGSNTKLTVINTVDTLQAAGFTKIAAVSNFYHLARIKMLYLAQGIDVVTVPSVPNKSPDYPLLNVVREIPGWWYYWFYNLVE